MSDLANLQARRTAVIAEIAVICSTTAGGLPNQSGIDHVGYKRSLYEELKMLDELIDRENGPFEIETFGDS